MTGTPREKIVVVEWASGVRRFITRARLCTPAGELTLIGDDVTRRIAGIDGVQLAAQTRDTTPVGFTAGLSLIHAALWSWDEVEPKVVAAFAEALGVELDVVRDNQAEAGS